MPQTRYTHRMKEKTEEVKLDFCHTCYTPRIVDSFIPKAVVRWDIDHNYPHPGYGGGESRCVSCQRPLDHEED